MKTLLLGSVASVLIIGVALAQAPTNAPATSTQSSATTVPAATTAPNTTTGGLTGKAAASGNDNQAVATTSASADQPAKGSNSFTQGEAASHIEAKGFTNVSGLTKDQDGIWRGTAQKDGQSRSVWLDYKGNVGQQS